MATECQLLIIDQLDILSLLNIAQINKHFAMLARDTFRRKYSDQLIEFKTAHYPGRIPINMGSSSTEIRGYKVGLKVLEYLGSAIRKIHLGDYQIDRNTLIAYMSAINKYCSKSNELHLYYLESDTLKQLTHPFEHVESLTLNIEQITNGTLSLNQLFPALRSFALVFRLYMNGDFINCELPHLEHFSASFVYQFCTVAMEIKIEKLLQKNPHIRSIHLCNFSNRLLRKINELLPNLDILNITNRVRNGRDIIDGGGIRMESVKTLISPINVPDQMIFPTLQEFHMRYVFFYSIPRHQIWQEFFHNHRSIKRLYVDLAGLGELMYFNRFTIELPELTEIHIDNQILFTIDDIIHFIMSNANLTVFRLNRFNKEHQMIFHELLQHEWHISKYNSDGILLQKKLSK